MIFEQSVAFELLLAYVTGDHRLLMQYHQRCWRLCKLVICVRTTFIYALLSERKTLRQTLETEKSVAVDAHVLLVVI